MFELGGDLDRLVSGKFLAESHSAAEALEATSIINHQREAAAALSDHTNEDIFAWLKLVRSARSIEPIPEQRPESAHLSPSQIHALLALKDCPNDRLLSLLELARLCGNGSTATALARSPPIESGFINNPSSRLGQSDASSFETESWMENTVEESSELRLSSASQRLLTHNRYGLHSATPFYSTLSRDVENHYWCTVCENPNSYKDSGNWKKHEKGHETLFVCGLDDGVEDSRAGQSSSTKPFSCKRRDIMVNHLTKSHGISAVEQGRELADKWRISVKKQAWSCGFCGNLFLNFQDRLKHIDTEHFRKYESMQDWDFCKVIHGLLRHPKMEIAWKKRTASLLPWVQPEDLVWTEAFAKTMRTKLEIGPSDESDANRLADEVYSAGRPKESWHGNAMAPASFVGMVGASLSAPNPDQAFTAQASGSAADRRPSSSTMRATAYVSGDSFVGRPLGHAYDRDSRAVPSMASSDEDSGGDHDVSSFYPSQNWVVASETSNDHCGFGQAVTEANRGPCRSTSDWNGQ